MARVRRTRACIAGIRSVVFQEIESRLLQELFDLLLVLLTPTAAEAGRFAKDCPPRFARRRVDDVALCVN